MFQNVKYKVLVSKFNNNLLEESKLLVKLIFHAFSIQTNFYSKN